MTRQEKYVYDVACKALEQLDVGMGLLMDLSIKNDWNPQVILALVRWYGCSADLYETYSEEV